MLFFDRFYSMGAFRKALWKHWYPFLTWRLQSEGIVFLNYALETEPPMRLPLALEDEPNRASIQLYHHITSPIDLRGKNVLEISCGHGGGASYLTRTHQPKSYTALDLNPKGIRFCQKRHQVKDLTFVQGDAEKLPFAAGSFDVVLNVEASHCYADFPRFLSEVARVLRPNGHFLYADFRDTESIPAWEQALSVPPFRQLHLQDISQDVLRGMDRNSDRSKALVVRKLPLGFHTVGGDFAGVKGSRIYNALKAGTLFYRSGCFLKESGAASKTEGARALAVTES